MPNPPYRQRTDGCLDDASLGRWLEKTEDGLAWCRHAHQSRTLPLFALPGARDDLAGLAAFAEELRGDFRDVVVLGTGGSSLGGRALAALADPRRPETPRLHFPDNLDGHGFAGLLTALDVGKTHFIAISKSGGTAETLAQLLAAMDHVRAHASKDAFARAFSVITQPSPSVLRRLAEKWRLRVMNHDPGLGGRFSVLSLVGLLPAYVLGLDGAAVRDGARTVLEATLAATRPGEAAPAVGAALAVGLAERGASVSVMLAYADRLDCLALWYRQLWAESLGKDGHGTTPVRALGPVDQHSQLQLYLDGPDDKFFSIIQLATAGDGPRVPADLAADAALDYLAGRTLGDLVDAECRATAQTLAGAGRPVRRFELDRLDEYVLGGLMMHFMLETILAAHLLGVDAFDQPAVEQAKVLARRYLREDASP